MSLEFWSNIAAIVGAFVSLVGFPLLGWQLFIARSQRREAIRLSTSQVLLAADAVIARHAGVAAKSHGGDWAGEKVLLRLCLPNLRGRLPFLGRLVHRHYDTVRLLRHVHVRRAAYGLRGPALIVRPRRAGDLVLVRAVSQRARVLRLRRTDSPLAFSVAAALPSACSE
jgi:hypothetical protein